MGSYSGETITKYYFAGAARIAVRKYSIPASMEVEYILSDHLGSSTLTTDKYGNKVSEIRYKPWGEIRSYAATPPANAQDPDYYQTNRYTFTGQYSDSTINLLWCGSRHYDPALGRFIQPDSIVPVASQGVQAHDRYAYVREKNGVPMLDHKSVNFANSSGVRIFFSNSNSYTVRLIAAMRAYSKRAPCFGESRFIFPCESCARRAIENLRSNGTKYNTSSGK